MATGASGSTLSSKGEPEMSSPAICTPSRYVPARVCAKDTLGSAQTPPSARDAAPSSGSTEMLYLRGGVGGGGAVRLQ